MSRVVLRNFKSIGYCDVRLEPLTYLVGQNGAGKSNFVDAIHFVRDALSDSLQSAINKRGGLNEVRRRSSGHPNHFAIRLEFTLPDGRNGLYAFGIGSIASGGYEVQNEECAVLGEGKGPSFRVSKGQVKQSSEQVFPSVTADRLALVAVSGMTAFRPVFDALTSMGFYNLNPEAMKELQKPQDGRMLTTTGDNIASVIGHLQKADSAEMQTIQEYLQSIAPMVHGVQRKAIGPMESLEFRQDIAGAKHPWRFLAQNMSDGTLRALGVLAALLQGGKAKPPVLVGIEEPETALHPAASASLREVLIDASATTQVLVTSHSPELLDDYAIDADSILAVISDRGDTKIAPLDKASRQVMRDHLFSAGELLRMDQLAPDEASLDKQAASQTGDLFGEAHS